MKIIRIPKKRKGEYRTIYWPNNYAEMLHFKRLLPRLERICEDTLSDCVHGFRPFRSPVTNAKPHVGYKYTVTFDLQDFFDSVSAEHLKDVLADGWLKDVMEVGGVAHEHGGDYHTSAILAHGAPRQGLPTSPLVANLAAAAMDREIENYVGRWGVYTRYADDLSISTNDEWFLGALVTGIPMIAGWHKFTLNPSKTHVLRASAGRRVITGVAVGEDGIYSTRRTKRKLRAAQHHIKVGRHVNLSRRSAKGLAEWMKLREPGLGRNHKWLSKKLEKELTVQGVA